MGGVVNWCWLLHGASVRTWCGGPFTSRVRVAPATWCLGYEAQQRRARRHKNLLLGEPTFYFLTLASSATCLGLAEALKTGRYHTVGFMVYLLEFPTVLLRKVEKGCSKIQVLISLERRARSRLGSRAS